MTKKGRSPHMKRVAAPRTTKILKKTHVWLKRQGPGSHPVLESVPLTVILRDYLGLASNSKEADLILNNRDVLVDGRVVKNGHFPIGIMDVISFPKMGKSYRATIDKKKRIVLDEVDEKKSKMKLCRIKRKVTSKKGSIMLGLHDGKSVPGDKNYKVGDTVFIKLPDNKVEKLYKLESGANCLIIKGKHAGSVGKLKELRNVGNKKYEAYLEEDGNEIITTKECLFVVGDDL